MKITNIELNNTTYNNYSDIFSALVSMTLDNALLIDGIRAAYSDDFPVHNKIEYPDGFHFSDEEEQMQIQEQVLTAVARGARQHDKKIIHDAVKKFMTRTNNKK